MSSLIFILCGSIKQPVSDNPADGEIDIHFAIIPAIKPSKPDEAVLGFAGGPGQSATELAASFDRDLRFARESRDILLVDQGLGCLFRRPRAKCISLCLPVLGLDLLLHRMWLSGLAFHFLKPLLSSVSRIKKLTLLFPFGLELPGCPLFC